MTDYKKKEAKATLINTLTASAAGVVESKYIIPNFWDVFKDFPHSYHFGVLLLLYASAVFPPLKKFNFFPPREEGESREKYFLYKGVRLFAHASLWSAIYDMASYIATYGLEKVEWLKQVYPEYELFGKQISEFPLINVYNSLLLTAFLSYIGYTNRDRINSTFANSYNVLSNINKKVLSRIVPEHCKENLKDSAIYQKINKFEGILYI